MSTISRQFEVDGEKIAYWTLGDEAAERQFIWAHGTIKRVLFNFLNGFTKVVKRIFIESCDTQITDIIIFTRTNSTNFNFIPNNVKL